MPSFEIAGALASLKAASEIAKAMIGLRDATAIQLKVIELNGEILSAQSSALSAQEAQSALLQRVGNLEKEIADLKAWDAEKERHELKEVHPGSFAYALKPDSGSTEPPHSLCARCFNEGHKSILQKATHTMKDWLHCSRCKAEIIVGRHSPTARIVRT